MPMHLCIWTRSQMARSYQSSFPHDWSWYQGLVDEVVAMAIPICFCCSDDIKKKRRKIFADLIRCGGGEGRDDMALPRSPYRYWQCRTLLPRMRSKRSRLSVSLSLRNLRLHTPWWCQEKEDHHHADPPRKFSPDMRKVRAQIESKSQLHSSGPPTWRLRSSCGSHRPEISLSYPFFATDDI